MCTEHLTLCAANMNDGTQCTTPVHADLEFCGREKEADHNPKLLPGESKRIGTFCLGHRNTCVGSPPSTPPGAF